MNNKNWSVFLGWFQIENMDCLLFASTFRRVLKKKKRKEKKIKLQIEWDWVWKYYTEPRTNCVKLHQTRINLVFLRSVFGKGGEGPGKIINVKEP